MSRSGRYYHRLFGEVEAKIPMDCVETSAIPLPYSILRPMIGHQWISRGASSPLGARGGGLHREAGTPSATLPGSLERAALLGHRFDDLDVPSTVPAAPPVPIQPTSGVIQRVWKVHHDRREAYWEQRGNEKRSLYQPLGYREVASPENAEGFEDHVPGPKADKEIALGYNDLYRVRGRRRGKKGDGNPQVTWGHDPITVQGKSGSSHKFPKVPVLASFADAVGAKHYPDWGEDNPDLVGMQKGVTRAIGKADRIHFNLDGFERDRGGRKVAQADRRRKRLTELLDKGTEWQSNFHTVNELGYVLKNQAVRDRTHFYRGGRRLDQEEAKRFFGKQWWKEG